MKKSGEPYSIGWTQVRLARLSKRRRTETSTSMPRAMLDEVNQLDLIEELEKDLILLMPTEGNDGTHS